MKKCTHCGKEIEDSASACPYCSWYQPKKEDKEDNMKWAEGFVAGLVIAVIIVIIGFQEPVLDYFMELLYDDFGDMQNAGIFALFGSWVVAAIVGIVVWIVVAKWLGKREAKKDSS